MKHYGIDNQYLLQAESVASLPEWSSTYERSFIYVEDRERMYYGSQNSWILLSKSLAYSAGTYTNPTVTDNEDGTITLGTGVYSLYASADGAGTVDQYTVAGDTFTPSELVPNYIVCNYNNGGDYRWHLENLMVYKIPISER